MCAFLQKCMHINLFIHVRPLCTQIFLKTKKAVPKMTLPFCLYEIFAIFLFLCRFFCCLFGYLFCGCLASSFLLARSFCFLFHRSPATPKGCFGYSRITDNDFSCTRNTYQLLSFFQICHLLPPFNFFTSYCIPKAHESKLISCGTAFHDITYEALSIINWQGKLFTDVEFSHRLQEAGAKRTYETLNLYA